jgi:N-acetylglucosamine kinase-like BadF-type ATPase
MTENDPAAHPVDSGGTPFVIGVDGSGTGTRAMVMDIQGRELGIAEGPPALIDPSNPGAVAYAMAGTVMGVVRKTGLKPLVRALWTGLAGAGLAGAREAVEIALRSLGLATDTRVGMDVEGAHWDAFGSGPGVLLAVGTGSMVWGRDPEGYEVRVGGFGKLLGVMS